MCVIKSGMGLGSTNKLWVWQRKVQIIEGKWTSKWVTVLERLSIKRPVKSSEPGQALVHIEED